MKYPSRSAHDVDRLIHGATARTDDEAIVARGSRARATALRDARDAARTTRRTATAAMLASTMTPRRATPTRVGLAKTSRRPSTTRRSTGARAQSVQAAALNTTRSSEIFKAAQDILPGGVNSPVRAFKSVGGNPIVFDRVKGAYAFDVDGNKYVDYVGSWGPAICGHANDRVNEK